MLCPTAAHRPLAVTGGLLLGITLPLALGFSLFLGLILLLSCGCSLSCSGSAGLELGWWQQEGLGGGWAGGMGAGGGGLCACLSVPLCPCRHGQLGHGLLEAELQPRLVEALAGVPMRAVAAGGWHSASLSGEGLGWAGQLGVLLAAHGPGGSGWGIWAAGVPGAPSAASECSPGLSSA